MAARRLIGWIATLAVALAPALHDLAAQGGSPPGRSPDLSALDLEQLMQLEVIYAASKREQTLRDAPSAVSIVTAADIRQHGYRTLADILRTIPSFYISYDRNYSYVGVRGFSRPGDYNSRILLLVNGLRTNENLYDMAYVGDEFIVDVDLIERVEVVRGPSAAIYGSSAFFAVINVVTRRGGDLSGGELTGVAGSLDTYGGRVTYGDRLAGDVDVLLSGSYSDAAGHGRLYFQEFDDPSTNDGIAQHNDGESVRRLLATVARGGLSFQASHVSRDKRYPTAAFETLFNDPRARTTDELSLASVAYNRPFAGRSSIGARLHAGRTAYQGDYPYDGAAAPNHDEAIGEWWGVDLDATHTLLQRHFLTAGVEYRDNYRQDQRNFDPEPQTVYVDVHHRSDRVGVFAQDEISLGDALTLYLGVRHDHYETFGSATSPRVGLILDPTAATTVKLLFGRAFRAPNEYELFYSGSGFKQNPLLQPEEIETMEIVGEHLVSPGLRLTAAGFRNRISGMISLENDPVDDLLAHQNVGEIESDGLELGIDLNRGHGITGRASYAFQKSRDAESDVELTNSPRHMAKLELVTPLVERRLFAGIDAQYESSRRTLAGSETPGFTVANLTLRAPALLDRIDASASIFNLFGARYGNPGSEEHVQDIIQQDGRSFRVKATFRF